MAVLSLAIASKFAMRATDRVKNCSIVPKLAQWLLPSSATRCHWGRFLCHLSLAEIALSVGCAGQSHLNCHFKRFVGLTPCQFRQS
ncbi:MAG: AraC family transcriptional regulator [Synechococcales cyanobacterium C42_A2020_086]|nr:AraC family transcriptional regulator [Synechococcales cyanobacterium C42_A2020_086]